MRLKIFAAVIIMLTAFSAFASEIKKGDMDDIMSAVKSHDGRTLLVLWAPWCPYCLKELKTVRDNYDYFQSNNVQVIGISRQGEISLAQGAVDREGFPHRFIAVPAGLMKDLQRQPGIPVSIVYNPDGTVYDFEIGAQEMVDLKIMLED